MNPDLIKYIYEEAFHPSKKLITAVLWNDKYVTIAIPYEWLEKNYSSGKAELIGKAVYNAVKDVVLNQLTDELYKKIKVNPKLPKKTALPLSPPIWETAVKGAYDKQLAEYLDASTAGMFAEAYKDSQLDDSTIVKPTTYTEPDELTKMVQKGVINPKQMMDYINTFKNLDAPKSPSYKPPGSNKVDPMSDHLKGLIAKNKAIPIKKPSGLSADVVTKLAKFIPALTEYVVDECPACREAITSGALLPPDWPSGHPQKGMPWGSAWPPRKLSDMIILLNDVHDWEREGKTSEWLESLPCDITFREPGPKGPLADLPPVEAFDPGQFPPF